MRSLLRIGVVLPCLILGCRRETTPVAVPVLYVGGEAMTYRPADLPPGDRVAAVVPDEGVIPVDIGTRVRVIAIEQDKVRVNILEGRQAGRVAQIDHADLMPLPESSPRTPPGAH